MCCSYALLLQSACSRFVTAACLPLHVCCLATQTCCKGHPSLLRALIGAFGGPYYALGVLKVCTRLTVCNAVGMPACSNAQQPSAQAYSCYRSFCAATGMSRCAW